MKNKNSVRNEMLYERITDALDSKNIPIAANKEVIETVLDCVDEDICAPGMIVIEGEKSLCTPELVDKIREAMR